jgi:hypothetical protein
VRLGLSFGIYGELFMIHSQAFKIASLERMGDTILMGIIGEISRQYIIFYINCCERPLMVDSA